MNELVPTAATAVSVTGWGLHTLWMRRRLESARHDPLSGLLTREPFEPRAEKLLLGGPRAVVLIDLDGFKAVNDTHGHAAGDALIHATGHRLTQWNRIAHGVVARLGGDEFAAVSCVYSLADLRWTLDGLESLLTESVEYEGRLLPVRASIGAYLNTQRPTPELPAALRRADEAMYAAKQNGGGWQIAHDLDPAHETVNGRRSGRDGTQRPEGRTTA